MPEAQPAEAKEELLEVPHLAEVPHVEPVEPPDPRCVGAVAPGKIAALDAEAGCHDLPLDQPWPSVCLKPSRRSTRTWVAWARSSAP